MIEKVRVDENEEEVKLGGFIGISGTIFSTIGKSIVAIGVTGILMFVFMKLEIILGLGALYAGAFTIATGVIAMSLGNRFKNGFWLEGLRSL
jgi:hypothetical protein